MANQSKIDEKQALEIQNDEIDKNAQQTKVKSSALDNVQIEVESSSGDAQSSQSIEGQEKSSKPKEINGPKGLEPTRYGDWESKGRCYDF
jgi:hypothetical protein